MSPEIPMPTLAHPAKLHEAFLERAAGRKGAEASRSALGGFLVLRLIDQLAELQQDRPAALAYQLKATRSFVDDLHPRSVEVNHLRELVQIAERIRTAEHLGILWAPLLAYAYWLEQELCLSEALDVLDTTLALGESNELVSAQLQRARVLRLLGRLDEARTAYAEGGLAAEKRGDSHAELLSRIGLGIVHRQAGNLPESRRTLRSAAVDAQRLGDRDAEARAHHDLAGTLFLGGKVREAVQLAYRACQLYEEPMRRMRALSDVGLFLKELGLYAPARRAFSVVLSSDPPAGIRTNTVLEVLDLCGLCRDRLSFQRARAELSAQYDDLPAEQQFDFEFKLGVGLWRFGRPDKADSHLQRAIQVAEQHGLGHSVFQAEGMLAHIRGRRSPDDRQPTPVDDSHPPDLSSTLAGLEGLETVSSVEPALT